MWIVTLALRRPYTFVVVALLITILGSVFSFVTPKDIFPNLDIPVVSVIWSYTGLPAEEFAQRVTTYSEYSLSNNVNDVERIESQTVDGIGIIRLYFHPGAEVQTAVAQATAVSQAILRRLPTGILPPIILRFYANTVPLVQMILSSQIHTESELYDYGNFRIRQGLATIPGTTLPTPYGGKVRQAMVDVNPEAMQAKGISARDINTAVTNQVVTLPTGDARIGDIDYRLNMNNTPDLVSNFNDIPIKVVDNAVVYLRDVGYAHDGFAPQTNIVREDGHRAVLMTILKNGAASTLDIVGAVWDFLPTIRAAAPKGMEINLLFDQSVFVRRAIASVLEEGALAALLTGMMMLVFLGSWRSTLIVLISIPLSILTSIIFLSLIGHTLNVMTLGGLALAIGILVDDATVTIENIHRNIEIGKKDLLHAVLDGSHQVAIPAFVSTLSICIVFIPVVLLTGPSKFLFVPFALAVVFAVSASYFLSRTLVPVMINFMLPAEIYLYTGGGPRTWLDRQHVKFEEGFHRLRHQYAKALHWALEHRGTVCLLFSLLFLSALMILPFIGRDFFPSVDANQLRLHVKARSGTRIEVTEEIFGRVEDEIKKVIPPSEIAMMIDNIGLASEPYSLAFGDNATLGTSDGEILVALKTDRQHSTQEYMQMLRKHLNEKFSDLLFYFQPADMVSQILNFGLPTPIDVRVIGYDKAHNIEIAKELVQKISRVPGAVDVHLHQILDQPEFFLNVDRTLLDKVGITQRDIVNDVLNTYSTSTVVTPNFWLDRVQGIPYLIAVQLPKYQVNSLDEVMRMPVSSPLTQQSQLLSNLATVERRSTVGVENHLNIQPVYDVYANVYGRDLGGVATDIEKIIQEYNKKMKPGNEIVAKGLVVDMETAFFRLGIGFIFAIMLVYFIMVINFQSWLDPFIIVMALPGSISGIIWMLFLTRTTFSIPSLMGTIMSIGVAIANSILVVTFANFLMKEGKTNVQAALSACTTRLRPVMMTALAMVVGMLPMAFGLGEGGEQNAPLGRAVIGGLLMATFTTLFFVPVIFSLLRKKPNPYINAEQEAYVPPKHEDVSSEDDE
ncbi:efflux RND transporter permease subunit [Parachlamydia acanthamoebae]|uniref:Nodulation protein nolG n=2 Tax=Parachlamydia acanthamoebae TaxID=83552 RepID=F8KUX1_PARAV|nr:efflux RND transporter permease subunit [Parachlamydia acanthamoebae]CCB85036.1 putative uncharacterized protein [Parachlamydia acanthamoebae UV-7]